MADHRSLSRHLDSLPGAAESLPTHPIRLFSLRLKAVWVLVNMLLSTAEVITVGMMPVPLFYLCYGAKAAAFVALGFLSPLAFQKLNRIGIGILSSFSCAVAIEIVQVALHNGHSFHWHEIIGKIALIIVGFALALERRYQRRIAFGPFSIQLARADV